MTTKPTRCCVLTQKGTRCANEPSPVRPVRMIGPVRLAACGLEAHQRALWSLPGFVRHDAYCGAFGCDRPSNAGICQKHRDQYRDFGITEHMLLAQEAPMPASETSPEVSHVAVAPTPPAAPQEAAGVGAPPELQIDRTTPDVRRWEGPALHDVGDVTTLFAAMSLELPRSATLRVGLRGAKGFCFFRVGPDEIIGTAVRQHFPDVGPVHAASVAVVEVAPPSPEAVEAFLLTAKPAPADDGEPSEGDVADALDSYPGGFATSPPAFGPTPAPADEAPLFVGGTDSAPAELVARWGHKHTAPVQPMSADLDGLAAPSPTVAELHAVCLLMQRLGSYGPDASAMLMRLLPVESRRALLEIEASDARGELARARANVVNPPPPERVAELTAKVATLDARIAALDAG